MPLILAALQGLPVRNIFRELSSGLVMVGYVITLLQFVLSGRFEWISGRIGIDRTMRFHQVTLWAILAFILVHPLLYVVPRLSLIRWSGHPLPDVLVAEPAQRRHRLVADDLARAAGGVPRSASVSLRAMAPEPWIVRDRDRGVRTGHTLRVGTYSADRWLAGFWIVADIVAVLAMLYVYVRNPCSAKRTVSGRVKSQSGGPDVGAGGRATAGEAMGFAAANSYGSTLAIRRSA